MVQYGKAGVKPFLNVFLHFFHPIKVGEHQYNGYYTFNQRKGIPKVHRVHLKFSYWMTKFFHVSFLSNEKSKFCRESYNDIIHKGHFGTHPKMNPEEKYAYTKLRFHLE